MAQVNLKFLQPEKLAIDPSSSSSVDDWKFWFKTFSNFINAMPGGENALKKLDMLTAHLTAPLYKLYKKKLLTKELLRRYKTFCETKK